MPLPTSSRIAAARQRHAHPAQQEGRCHSAIQPYRSYSKEDIYRTGAFDLDRALEKIDPIFSPSP
jgi:hypothetical protein